MAYTHIALPVARHAYFDDFIEAELEVLARLAEISTLLRRQGKTRGRLQFAENQTAGRQAASSYKALSRFVAKGGGKLDDATQSALLHLRDRLLWCAQMH